MNKFDPIQIMAADMAVIAKILGSPPAEQDAFCMRECVRAILKSLASHPKGAFEAAT
ncbi:hypothetical protein [Variovorax sp. LG9.2]|uniref:hypothetical protein n=1 Tax=Variovorax sp. LG9.2 TaxID=3048626 RepID=UPI002B2289A7|nr:hypothetical protein [Variovorax sp. LG9.2]MEB0058808.1 hypothetical protein [Variovorax sp. LG9.2]